MNRIIYTNNKLFAFKIVDSPYCAFCNNEEESLEHLLVSCKVADLFWKEVLSWIAIYRNEVMEISLIDVLFGKFNIGKDFMVINHILLLAKLFLYRCKLGKTNPSLDVFKAKLRATYNLEFLIARTNGALLKHYTKWDPFISILS